MHYLTFDFDDNIKVSVSFFENRGAKEYHLTFHPSSYESAFGQLMGIQCAYEKTLAKLGIGLDTAVFRRFFCSDLINQSPILQAENFSCLDSTKSFSAISWINQPPAGAAKIAMWAYHITGGEKIPFDNGVSLKLGSLTHHYCAALHDVSSESSYDQTYGIFHNLHKHLEKSGMTLSDNVVRTWFFVQNVDANYMGLVDARREIFGKAGLTKDTHYIASTGIEGSFARPECKVVLDYYAIDGLRPRQVEYIYALENLSPTHIYNVTFERASAVLYADRKHIFISGTASIDKHGQIMHIGDIARQFDRTLENIDALLAEAGSSREDFASLIVYLRDSTVMHIIADMLKQTFPDTPYVLVTAPVCRPGWLIEIEGIAIAKCENKQMPEFS